MTPDFTRGIGPGLKSIKKLLLMPRDKKLYLNRHQSKMGTLELTQHQKW